MASGEQSAGVERLWRASLPDGAVGLAWLGQAGFALRVGDKRLLIDPYLSDFLSEKYRGAEFPHIRLMPAPVEPGRLEGVAWVFCTHRHSDHMDPGTLSLLAITNPACGFVVPRAEGEAALHAGVPAERMLAMNAGESRSLGAGLTVSAIPAAHETLKANARGEHHFLGYIFKTPAGTIYHSGDCVPYAGLAGELARHQVDMALLPVNGRDAHRASRGIAGNFTFEEARQLCLEAGVRNLVAHHFGMFAFNTPTAAELERELRMESAVACTLPATAGYYVLRGGLPGRAPILNAC